jgi:hypothetical protein
MIGQYHFDMRIPAAGSHLHSHRQRINNFDIVTTRTRRLRQTAGAVQSTIS